MANFAYDPLNYHYLRELKVIELFINGLQSKNPFFVEYSLKGICNLCNDPLNQKIIFEKSGLNPLKELLKSENSELVKLSLTSLFFLYSSTFPSGRTIDTQLFLDLLINKCLIFYRGFNSWSVKWSSTTPAKWRKSISEKSCNNSFGRNWDWKDMIECSWKGLHLSSWILLEYSL